MKRDFCTYNKAISWHIEQSESRKLGYQGVESKRSSVLKVHSYEKNSKKVMKRVQDLL